MKITKKQLKKIIKEEIMKTLKEVNGELTEDEEDYINDLKNYYTDIIEEIVVDEDELYGDTVFIVRYREGYGEDSEHSDLEELEQEIQNREEYEEEGAQPQDPAELLRQWTREKPLYGMTPEHSEKIFLHQFRAGVFGEIRSTGEAKDAYDKLYRMLDPHDRSHLRDY